MNIINNSFLINNRNNYENIIKKITNYIVTNILLILSLYVYI